MRRNILIFLLLMIGIIVFLPLAIVGFVKWDKAPPVIEVKKEEAITIEVYNHADGKVMEMNLEEYIVGVLTAEMPADFEPEALKAQAVAARTYAYRKLKLGAADSTAHMGAVVCTNPAHCQAWTSMDKAKKNWGIFKAGYNARKVTQAVNETRGQILIYENEAANPLYHANSGGATENSEEVWEGVNVPYLRSVESKGEDKSKSFKVTVNITADDLAKTFIKKYPDALIDTDNIKEQLVIIDYTTGGRVKNIKVGNKEIKGTEFRSIFSLRSANFSFEFDDSGMVGITTLGFGHGVGMSQWGANNLAQKGASFDEILQYYYKGVEVIGIEEFENLQNELEDEELRDMDAGACQPI